MRFLRLLELYQCLGNLARWIKEKEEALHGSIPQKSINTIRLVSSYSLWVNNRVLCIICVCYRILFKFITRHCGTISKLENTIFISCSFLNEHDTIGFKTFRNVFHTINCGNFIDNVRAVLNLYFKNHCLLVKLQWRIAISIGYFNMHLKKK